MKKRSEFTKKFSRWLARQGLFVFSWLFQWLPYFIVRILAGILIGIGYIFTIRQKQIARESLAIAFGDKMSKEEINKTVYQNFTNLGRGMVEMIYAIFHPEFVDGHVTIKGKEHIEEALAKGKGVVAVTAHFGNFPLMMLATARMGFKTNALVRTMRDKEVESYLNEKRTACGVNTVYSKPRKKCVDQSIAALRRNEVLFIPLDQNFGSGGGVFVDFFGQKAATATGPVIFAKRTGATILPVFIRRLEGDQHQIIVEPAFDIEEQVNENKTIEHNISRITSKIEEYIRKYPHEWGWMHRRWKSRQFNVEYMPNA